MTAFPAEIIWSVCAFLLAGNLFFIRRLVNKIDKTGVSASQTRASLKLLNATVRGAERELAEIKSELKHVRHIETDVAVLKSFLKGFPSAEPA